MIRKAIAILLAVILLTCCAPLSYAADLSGNVDTFDMPYVGLHFTFPEEYRNLNGRVVTDGEIELISGVQYAYWLYCAIPEDGTDLLYNNPNISLIVSPLFYVFSVGYGMSFDDMNTLIGNQLSPEHAREICKIGSYTFYLYMEGPDQEFAAGIDTLYAEEYQILAGLQDPVIERITCREPENKYGYTAGQKVEFTTRDLKGNTVSSAEIFGQHEVTLLNVWATWCGPCIGELPELQQIHLRLQEKGCGVVGLLADADYSKARQLVSGNGVTYPVIQAPKNIDSLFSLMAYPTTFLIGRDGTVLSTPIIGAYIDLYEYAVNGLLNTLNTK